MSQLSGTSFEASAAAFRGFFDELRGVFLERETLFCQIELALLCREHVLVVGPPGTAKSAIAHSVLGRIVDSETGKPSLFAKQLSESTVQSDLIGPVNFKVLTETGRTEHLTDEGMLGAAHAFLDEVFDGRDMLLRSILNVLGERELKHGPQVTVGRCESAIMTSNRYLSEVLTRSPELLLAFADRLSFVGFTPKSFVSGASRGAMLHRAVSRQQAELVRSLSLQQLKVLQHAVDSVAVPGEVLDGLELLSDGLERELQAQAARLPDFVPTKYFSHRSMVKALWVLKAAVVRDRIYQRLERPLSAAIEDLWSLRHFYILGGPTAEECERMLPRAVDPREQAQLEIIRVENRAFDQVMQGVLAQWGQGAAVEAERLALSEARSRVPEALAHVNPTEWADAARWLVQRLTLGPRHPANRGPLLLAAHQLLGSIELQLLEGLKPPAGHADRLYALLGSLLRLARVTPELHARVEPFSRSVAAFAAAELESLPVQATGGEFEGPSNLETLITESRGWAASFSGLDQLMQSLSEQLGLSEEYLEKRSLASGRAAQAITRRARHWFAAQARGASPGLANLATWSRTLEELDRALFVLSPAHGALRAQLLPAAVGAYVREQVTDASVANLMGFAQRLHALADGLRGAGMDPAEVLGSERELIAQRLRDHLERMETLIRKLPTSVPSVHQGIAYRHYRNELAAPCAGLSSILNSLQTLTGGRELFDPSVGERVAQLEMAYARMRLTFLRQWLDGLLEQLPRADAIRDRQTADKAFDQFVHSRFPMLITREAELARLQAQISALDRPSTAWSESIRQLQSLGRGVAEDFGMYSSALLASRARL